MFHSKDAVFHPPVILSLAPCPCASWTHGPFQLALLMQIWATTILCGCPRQSIASLPLLFGTKAILHALPGWGPGAWCPSASLSPRSGSFSSSWHSVGCARAPADSLYLVALGCPFCPLALGPEGPEMNSSVSLQVLVASGTGSPHETLVVLSVLAS